MFSQIILEFVKDVSVIVVAGWILLHIEKRGNGKTRINRKDVALKESDIVRLIEDQLAQQEAHRSQRKEDDDKTG